MTDKSTMEHESGTEVPLRTSRGGALGQIMFCEGCCCGRVDRGKPEFPKEMIKSEWKSHKLNKVIQLTISGCLGPCDLVNVACVITAEGRLAWLGDLCLPSHYRAIVDWAMACETAGRLIELPELLRKKQFKRFTDRKLGD